MLNNPRLFIIVAVSHRNTIVINIEIRCSETLHLLRELMMRLLALSTTEVSNEERYICVVFSESCPNASLIVDTGTFLLLAMLAQEWRAT